MCACTFQPGNFTGLGSEGVKYRYIYRELQTMITERKRKTNRKNTLSFSPIPLLNVCPICLLHPPQRWKATTTISTQCHATETAFETLSHVVAKPHDVVQIARGLSFGGSSCHTAVEPPSGILVTICTRLLIKFHDRWVSPSLDPPADQQVLLIKQVRVICLWNGSKAGIGL